MKIENGYVYGASREDVFDLLMGLDDGVSVAKYVKPGMALYELEQLYMKLTGSNCFN